MNEKYPEDYPEDFEEKLIEAGATTKEVKPVYRILYDGELKAENFDSTFHDYKRRGRKITKYQLNDIGTYSTSVFLDIEEANLVRAYAMRNPPNARMAVGMIAADTGYNQHTIERTIERKEHELKTHCDWWIFGTISKEKEILPLFEVLKEGEDDQGKDV